MRALFCALLFAGCVAAQTVPLSGHIKVIGSDSMEDIMKLWIAGFTKIHPGVTFEMEAKSSLAVGPALTSGAAQLGPLGREFLQEEEDLFSKKHGYKPLSIPVAGGGYHCIGKTHEVVFVVNKANPLDKIDYQHLAAIYSQDHPVWGALGPTGEWADKPIHLWGLQKADGITHLLEVQILKGGSFKKTVREKVPTPTLPALDAVIKEITADRYALGYAGLAYLTKDVKSLALAKTPAGPYYKGTLEEVRNHTYPLSRFVYIHVDRPPDPKVKEFLRFALSKQGQADVIKEGVFLPLPPRYIHEALKQLE